MTTKDTTDEPRETAPAAPAAAEPAVAEPAQADTPTKETKEQPRAGVPLGHILLGGASATTLGGFYLASAVGPWAVAGVGATAVAGGAAYVHHRMARKRGGQGQASRTVKTQTTRTGGGALGRMGLGGNRRSATSGSGGAGPSSGGKRRGASAALGAVGTGRKSGGTSGAAGAARPAGGRGSGSSARPSAGRGSAGPRPLGGGRGPSGSSGRGLLGRRSGGTSGDSGAAGRATRKGTGRPHTTPPGDGGIPPSSGAKRSRIRMGRGRTAARKEKGGGAVGATTKTSPRGAAAGGRWGGASGPTGASKPGRLRAVGRRMGSWADGRTGRRASTAWKAASGARGFRARHRAAREALRNRANHHPAATGVFAALGAVLASLWAWQARLRAAQHARAQRAMDRVDPDAQPGDDDTHDSATAAGGASPQPGPSPTARPASDQPTTATPTAASAAGPTGRTTTMAGLPHARAATDMLSAAGRYEPDDAFAVVREAKEWPDVSRDVALSVRAYAQRLESARFPLDQACLSKLQEYYTALSQTVRIAEEIEPLLRKAHQVDLDRQDSPRGNESKWNV